MSLKCHAFGGDVGALVVVVVVEPVEEDMQGGGAKNPLRNRLVT